MVDIINIEELYKSKVLAIWNDFNTIPVLNELDREYRKSPILPKIVIKDSILFVGCNPSFRLGTVIEEDNKAIEFYSLNDDQKDRYFDKFKRIATYCDNSKWSHIDLIFMRETKQELVADITYTNVDFIKRQLEIAFEIISKSNPRVLVVTDSLSSEFFGKKKAIKHDKFEKIWKGFDLDFDLNFDVEIGAYWVEINGKRTPIVFSGMLSGQRAMDIGSYERLMWQIKFILKKACA